MRERKILAGALLVVLAFSSCTSYRNYRRAQMAATAEDWDQAVVFYMRAAENDPGNITYKAALLRAKISAAQAHFDKARRYQQSGVLDRALVEYQQAVNLDPSNQSAAVELEKVRQAVVAERENRRNDGSIDELKRRASQKGQPPTLNPRSNEPIDLDFPQPASIMDIYRALGRAFGINVLFDPNLKDAEIAVELKQVRAQDALEFLMRAAQHFYKVLDPQSIIIVADTPQNRRNYEDLVIKTFFLSNASVKEVVTMLRSLIDAKKIATNDQLNAIIVRDTADKVKLAERIIQANDKARAEVVVDVELLQINTSKLKDLGVTWPSQISTGIDLGENVKVRLSDLQFLNQSNWTITIPNFVYDFVKTSSDAQLLAKPQLRISEGEKASLVIGDRVPIPVTSFNSAQTVGGNIVPITSFQYQEVGIKINLEPRVHHNKEVTLKINVEVSNLAGNVQSGGSSQPIIGTRTIESTIRLKDGETNFLAGLMRTDETVSDSGLPGLSEIPIIGRLFSKNRTQNQRTDVILTLTPHIIRSADITEEDLLPIPAGTEANITFRGGSPRVESEIEGPFEDEVLPAGDEDIRELIQRRIQQLPGGADEQEKQEEVQGPAGIELVPQSPGSVFQPQAPPPPSEEPPPFGIPPADIEEPPPGPAASGGFASSALELDRRLPEVVLAASAAAVVEMRLAPQAVLIAPGDTFELAVVADAHRPVSHLPLRLTFDPEVLAVVEVRPGPFLGPNDKAQVLADFSRPGEIVLGASRLGALPGVSGQGPVALVRLRAVAAGVTDIRFAEAVALGADLKAIAPVTAAIARVQVLGSEPPGHEHPDHPQQES